MSCTFIVFNVKVTARAYIIKILLFLLYLLNSLSVCNQTVFSIISWSVLWKNGIAAFKVKDTANVYNVSVSDCACSVTPEPLNYFLPNLECGCIIMRQFVMWKYWFTIFNVKVTVKAHIMEI